METLFVGRNRIRLNETGSTNNYAAELMRQADMPEGTLVTAEYQSEGRGQRSRTWQSEPGANILCTYILKPVFLPLEHQFTLNKAVALAVLHTAELFVPGSFLRIKWPNDLLMEGRKMAGILVENTLSGRQIVRSLAGIGFNVNQTQFGALNNAAASLKTELEQIIPLEHVQDALSGALEAVYLKLRAGKFTFLAEEYDAYLWGRNEWHHFGEAGELCILHCDTEGRLVTQNRDEEIQHWEHGSLKFPPLRHDNAE